LILKKDIPGLFNAHILTIDDLTDRFLGAKALLRPTNVIRQSFLRSILEDTAKSWHYFEAVKNLKGFHRLLTETVKEFKANLLTVETFAAAAKPFLSEPGFGAKVRDFMSVMECYEEKLKRLGFAEPEDNIGRLLADPALLKKASLLIFDGFYHFTPAQQALIQAATKRTERILVTLTLPRTSRERSYVFQYPENTRTFLQGIGFKESRAKIVVNHRTDQEALKHLEKNIFLPQPPRFSAAQEAVRIFEADNARAEMEMIAREIRKIHLEEAVHYSDICVIFRTMSGSQKILEQVFYEYEIPLYVHERKKLLDSGWVRLVHRWIRLCLEGWKREDLFFLLRSSYRLTPSESSMLAEFECAAYSRNLLEGRQAWVDLSGDDKFQGGISDFVQNLVMIEDQLYSCNSVHEWAGRFREHLERWLPAEGKLCREDELSWQSILEILRQIKMSAGHRFEEPVSSAEMMERIRHSIETGLFSYKPSGKNRVQVYDVVMALPKEYKVVFISGLLETTFPKEVFEDPLWKDEEREKLRVRGAWLEPRALRLSGEKYFFYMALTRPKERLYLTYSLKDSEGRPSLPSFFAEEVRKCFSEKSLSAPAALSERNFSVQNWRSHREAEQGTAFILFQAPRDAFSAKERSLYLWLASQWVSQPRGHGILEAGYSAGEAVLTHPKALEYFRGLTGPFSATRLETYVTCAFKYFSQRILSLEVPADGRERMDMGTMLHEVLENFYKELSPGDRANAQFWEKNDVVEKALLDRYDRIFEKNIFNYLPLYRQKIVYKKIKEALVVFAQSEKELFRKRKLVPTYFELGFGRKLGGENAELPFLTLKEDVSIEGKIDRVDVDGTQKKALVVDYKLGKRNIHKKMKQGLELQMPIYLLAARKLLGLEALGAELRFLEKGEDPQGLYIDSAIAALGFHSRKKSYSADEMSVVLEDVEQNIIKAVRRLRQGDISVKSKSCEFCDYQTVCRFEPWKLVYSGVNIDESD
jgi:ATP-dependent helicase/nuclease subunit B